MKVILLQDVAKIGRRFEIVEVPSGYGLNKLIPQKMAKPATPENIKAVQAQSAKTASNQAHVDEVFAQALEAIKETVIEVVAEANEEGRLFQALKAEVIIEAIKEKTGKEVLASQLLVNSPIKEVGVHKVELTSGDISVVTEVTVVAK